MKPIQVFLDEGDYTALKIKAIENKTNVSEIIRKLVHGFVN